MKKKSEKIYQVLRRRVSMNVARLRAERGFSQTELSELTGLHVRHLQKIEAGEANATIDTLTRLSRGLGVDPRELIAPAKR